MSTKSIIPILNLFALCNFVFKHLFIPAGFSSSAFLLFNTKYVFEGGVAKMASFFCNRIDSNLIAYHDSTQTKQKLRKYFPYFHDISNYTLLVSYCVVMLYYKLCYNDVQDRMITINFCPFSIKHVFEKVHYINDMQTFDTAW